MDLGEVDIAICPNLPPHCRLAIMLNNDGERLLYFLALNKEIRGPHTGNTPSGAGTHATEPEVHLVRSSAGEHRVVAIESDLAAKLAAFLVPPSFLVLNRFLLTASGKLDRQALLSLTKNAFIRCVAVKRKPYSAKETIIRQCVSFGQLY